MPPSAGERTTVGTQRGGSPGDRAPERLGVIRVLQHERALQVAGAVQAGGQPEVPFEERPGSAEEIEQRVAFHQKAQYTIRRDENPFPARSSAV